MFKTVHDTVWAYDVEWVPDVVAGRMLYDLGDSGMSGEDVMDVMWRHGGATDANPRPFLKTVLCRIVSIAVVRRKRTPEGVSLDLLSLPRDTDDPVQSSEKHMLSSFLQALGRRCPQLVGYNSADSDLKILIQRAVVNGVSAAGFCRRPDKPWEGIDYFARDSEWNIDLMRVVGGWGKSTPSLHEIASLSGIPGKLGLDGGDVAGLWLAGRHKRIVDYNECDAVTTYLLWLRVAHFGGKFSSAEYEEEQNLVHEMLERESRGTGKEHLAVYHAEWNRLSRIVQSGSNGISTERMAGMIT